MEIIESNLESTISRTNQNTTSIQTLQEQLETANAKIDDLENRNRRYNFWVRGLPESYKDIPETIKSFIKDLQPETPQHRLELDRAHRALRPPRADGLPRDIVVKPHFFSIKEEVMRKSRSMSEIVFQGHRLQIFADLSPSTIQKRRTLKPLLQILMDRDIKYWWLFPFQLKLLHKGKAYTFGSLQEGEKLFLQLGFIYRDPTARHPGNQPNAAKRHLPTSPLNPVWEKARTKKSKETNPP